MQTLSFCVYLSVRIRMFRRQIDSDSCSLPGRPAGFIIIMTVPLITNAWAILINEPGPRYAAFISIDIRINLI